MTGLACSGGVIFKCLRALTSACLALLLSGCANLLFYPMSKLVALPSDWGLSYEDVTLKSEGLTLHGWWLPESADGPGKGTVYFLHGNAENISTHFHSVKWLPAQGYNVFLLDYRGYGLSEGEPDLPGVIADVRAGYAWLRERHGSAPLIVLGQSLGGGLAGFAMATEPVKPAAVVLDAAIASYPRIAGEVARRNWLTWPFAPLAEIAMPENYDFESVVGQLAGVPLLFFHSTEDSVVPQGHTRTLFELAHEPKYKVLTQGPHIATFALQENREHLLAFLNRLDTGVASPP